MLTVLPRRLLGAIPVLFVLVLAVFILQQVAPVDPVAAVVGAKASPRCTPPPDTNSATTVR